MLVGPEVILANDYYPRTVNPDVPQKNSDYWQAVEETASNSASIGTGSICVAPVEMGAGALVAAGSIVVKILAVFALLVGIPAKRIQWVGKSGMPLLSESGGCSLCPKYGACCLECNSERLVEVN